MPPKSIALGALAALSLTSAAWAETQQLVSMANGELVGSLTATTNGRETTVDYAVSNNGRGPKAHEVIKTDAKGVPVQWTIDGQSLFGAPVKEAFTWNQGVASWTSQADQGQAPSPTPRFYIGNDASPWMMGLYVKALLKAQDHKLSVFPAGELRLEEVGRLTVGEGRSALKVTAYAISGINTDPSIVYVDNKGKLFATGGLVRKGYEGQQRMLSKFGRERNQTRAEEAQRKLAHRYDGPIRIRNVRVFDPASMTLGQPSTVVIYRDRVTAVIPGVQADAPPNDETIIDGQGGTLMPGLHDMHSHTSLSSNLYNLAAGVTGTRDQGNNNNDLLMMIDGLNAGRLAGPRIVRNGFLEGRSPYSARNGYVVDSLEEALKDVRWYADRGYWQIKIYSSMNPAWVAPIAAEAHRLGMGVTGHVPAFTTPDQVIREGYNDIAHVNQLMLGWILDPKEDTRTPLRLTAMVRGKDLDLNADRVQSTVKLMQEKHVALDTTAMILERLMLSRSGQVQEGDVPYLDHTQIGYQRYRKRTFVTVSGADGDAAWKAAFQKVLDVLKMLDDKGVQLLPGTDDGVGFGLHRELELYVKAGIPAPKVLRLATLDAERYFKRDNELGTIERGKLADFILLDGDPTANISAVRKVRMTVVGGVVYFPSEIYEHLSVRPFTTAPPVTPAKIAPKPQSGDDVSTGEEYDL